MDPFKVIQNSERLLAYFSFPECSVCTSLRPKIKELTAQQNDVEFLYVDTSTHPTAAGQFLVFSTPTVIYFENGSERNRWSRVFSVREVDDVLQKHNGQK